ncbi:Potassium channel, partial [Linderina macrospora]
MSSVKEKDGGDMETGIDDLPPMRLGREITNDLRRIELTFSNQPEETQSRRANPLKHLIKSRHNFRALVTYGGYLIPINVLLNVILLGRGWLQYNEPGPDGRTNTVTNPVGYLITSVMSLILIVASGICFVLRCLEFDVMRTTMTSIIANFVNAVLILASAVIYEKNERPRHPDAHITGEFYSSYAGAAVALLNALLLLMDMLITPGFRYRGSGMSRQQRMLQFNIILIVVWIGIGGYAWSKIEGWDTPTSIMFCMVTVTTIGFGNKSPTKTYSRVLQFIYGPLGILMFGMMLLHTRN